MGENTSHSTGELPNRFLLRDNKYNLIVELRHNLLSAYLDTSNSSLRNIAMEEIGVTSDHTRVGVDHYQV